MNERKLQILCAKWQRRLGLADWDVRIRWVGLNEMDEKYVDGHVQICRTRRRARISLVRPVERSESWVRREDTTELLVIHELLHLLLDPMGAEKKAECLAEEQAIEAISSALVRREKED